MGILSFVATSAMLSCSADSYGASLPTLSYGVRLNRNHTMKLATGEVFSELDGRLTLLADADDAQSSKKHVGRMGYFAAVEDEFHPSPASYLIEVRISNNQLNELLAAARVGRIPAYISVETGGEGLEYDWQPDGSGMKWDNNAFPELDVVSANFKLSLVVAVNRPGFRGGCWV